MTITELVNQIIKDGKITQNEYEGFLAKVKEDGQIDAEEKEQITRLMAMIDRKELTIEKFV
ncbi:MAG: hypothetical protein Q9M28_02495 [Mariprofundaceae bacterium]|nr:hypothetical protein [Mariprofundaceae bacterium]